MRVSEVVSFIHTPDAFIGAIEPVRKRTKPLKVREMCQEDFYDWKGPCTQMNFTLHKEEDNNPIELMGAKVITVQKDTLNNSYAKNEFQKAIVIKKRKDGITEIITL